MDHLNLKAGDDCPSCRDHWDAYHKPRQKLVLVASTQNKKIMVLACPYCDGQRAIDLSRNRNS
jgi:hypothetical protein